MNWTREEERQAMRDKVRHLASKIILRHILKAHINLMDEKELAKAAAEAVKVFTDTLYPPTQPQVPAVEVNEYGFAEVSLFDGLRKPQDRVRVIQDRIWILCIGASVGAFAVFLYAAASSANGGAAWWGFAGLVLSSVAAVWAVNSNS